MCDVVGVECDIVLSVFVENLLYEDYDGVVVYVCVMVWMKVMDVYENWDVNE